MAVLLPVPVCANQHFSSWLRLCCTIQDKIAANVRDLLDLQKAVQEEGVENLQRILKHLKKPSKVHLLDAKNEYGQTTILIAASAGNLKAAQVCLLLDCGLSVRPWNLHSIHRLYWTAFARGWLLMQRN
jgi:hypothetical protein